MKSKEKLEKIITRAKRTQSLKYSGPQLESRAKSCLDPPWPSEAQRHNSILLKLEIRLFVRGFLKGYKSVDCFNVSKARTFWSGSQPVGGYPAIRPASLSGTMIIG